MMGKHYDIVKTPEGEEYRCKHCDFITKSKGEMLRHHNPKDPNRCKGRDWEAEAEEEELERGEVEAKKLDIKGMTPREVVAQYGIDGLEELMKDRLVRYLGSAPGVSKKTRAWIIQQWDTDESIRRDPNMLYNVLTESGVQDRIAWRITNAINALFNELSPLLEGPPPLFPAMRTPVPQRGFWPSMAHPVQRGYPSLPLRSYPQQPQYPYGYGQPYGAPSQQFYTAEDLRREREETEREHRLRKVEEKTSEITRTIESLGSQLTRSINELKNTLVTPQGKYIEEDIAVDENLNPCDPAKAVTVITRRRPVEEKKESLLDTLSKLKDAGLILTPNKISEVVRQVVPQQPAKPPEVEKLETKLEEYSKKLEEMKEKMEREKVERIKEQLERTSEELKTHRSEITSQPKGEYREDQFRLLDTTLREVAKREPIKVVVELAEKALLPGTGVPPERKKTPGARGKILDELRKHGLTVPR